MDAKLECEVDVEGTVVMMVRGYEDNIVAGPPYSPLLQLLPRCPFISFRSNLQALVSSVVGNGFLFPEFPTRASELLDVFHHHISCQ